MRFVLPVLILFASLVEAGQFRDAVLVLEYEELYPAFGDEKVSRLLGDAGSALPEDERSAAAILVAAGAISAADLKDGLADNRLHVFLEERAAKHPALVGRFDDPSLSQRMYRYFDHASLLSDNVFLDSLGSALAAGIITGYDLRALGVYDGFPKGLTFVYSQSSLRHMQQLLVLLASENVAGSLYITPKVSAFVFRDDWGEPSSAVVTLDGGLRVVQGREIAVQFRFDTLADRDRFHELVRQYAKKDAADEPGLIANAWWQPFYYTDEPFADFERIQLIVLSSEQHEATLTVLPEKTGEVLKGLPAGPWETRVDEVWVNPAFYRFLNGGYK